MIVIFFKKGPSCVLWMGAGHPERDHAHHWINVIREIVTVLICCDALNLRPSKLRPFQRREDDTNNNNNNTKTYKYKYI